MLALFLGTVATAFAPSTALAAGRNLTGSPAPEIYVPQGLFGLQSGTTLASLRGHVVVLKFFFTGCPTCRASLPEFESLYRRYASRGVQFIALAYDSASNVSYYWPRNGLTVPVAVDESGVTPGRYGISTYPTNYVIGADGVVVAYDDLRDWVIERALTSAGSSAPAPAPAAVGLPLTAREKNLKEIGDVPLALAGVRDAAAENDYGAVLRIAEKVLAAPGQSADVVAAAKRVEAIAKQRYENRLARIESPAPGRRRRRRPRGAPEDGRRLPRDAVRGRAARPLAIGGVGLRGGARRQEIPRESAPREPPAPARLLDADPPLSLASGSLRARPYQAFPTPPEIPRHAHPSLARPLDRRALAALPPRRRAPQATISPGRPPRS